MSSAVVADVPDTELNYSLSNCAGNYLVGGGRNEEILHNIRPILMNIYSHIRLKQNTITNLTMNNKDKR